MSWGVIGPPEALVYLRQNEPNSSQALGSVVWRREVLDANSYLSHGRSHASPTCPVHFQGYLHHLDALPLNSPPKQRENLTAWAWQSYLQWGHELVLHLRGDYSIVIWDESQQKVLALTDPFGAKPLYYSCVDDCFFYSSSLPKLLNILPKQPSICHHKMIGFLTHDMSHEDQSFYEGVFRLLPGQILYWSIAQGLSFRVSHPLEQPSPEFKHTKNSDWIEDFKERFSRSVKTRMKSEAHTECLLSGGLDSSSIVGMAQQNRTEKLKTLSLTFPLYPDSDERSYVHSMIKYGHLDPHFLDTSNLDPFFLMNDWFEQTSEPSSIPNFYLRQTIYQQAQQHGSKQILDGTDGDIVVSHGLELPWLQFKNGHWRTMSQSLKALGATFGIPTPQLFKRLILKPLIPELYFRFKKKYKVSPSTFHKVHEQHLVRDQHSVTPHPSYRQAHAETILDPINGHIFRGQHAMSNPHGVHISYPFFDVDLIQLCLNLPEKMISSHGYTRFILRKAMINLIPEDVRWRQKKSKLGHHFQQRLYIDRWSDIWEELNSFPLVLKDLINVEELCQYWLKCKKQPDQAQLDIIWPIICLSLWLKKLL